MAKFSLFGVFVNIRVSGFFRLKVASAIPFLVKNKTFFSANNLLAPDDFAEGMSGDGIPFLHENKPLPVGYGKLLPI